MLRQTGVATSTCERRNSGNARPSVRSCRSANSSGGGSLATAPRLEVDEQVLLLDAEGQRRFAWSAMRRLLRAAAAVRRIVQHRADDLREQPHPAFDARGGLELVLSHLDADVRQARRARRGDRSCSWPDACRCRARCRRRRVPASPQPREQAPCVGLVRSQSTPTCQGRSCAAQRRRETVHGHEQAARCPAHETRQHRGDALVVGIEKAGRGACARSTSSAAGCRGSSQPSLSARNASASSGADCNRRPDASSPPAPRAHPARAPGRGSAPRRRCPRRCAARSPVPASPSRCKARGNARLAWSQTTRAGAAPCSCRTTNGGGSSRPSSACCWIERSTESGHARASVTGRLRAPSVIVTGPAAGCDLRHIGTRRAAAYHRPAAAPRRGGRTLHGSDGSRRLTTHGNVDRLRRLGVAAGRLRARRRSRARRQPTAETRRAGVRRGRRRRTRARRCPVSLHPLLKQAVRRARAARRAARPAQAAARDQRGLRRVGRGTPRRRALDAACSPTRRAPSRARCAKARRRSCRRSSITSRTRS